MQSHRLSNFKKDHGEHPLTLGTFCDPNDQSDKVEEEANQNLSEEGLDEWVLDCAILWNRGQ